MRKQVQSCVIALVAIMLLSLGAKAQYLATWGVRNYSDTLAPGSTGAVGTVATGITASRLLITDSTGKQTTYTGPTLGSGAGARKTRAAVAYYKGGRQMEGVLVIKKKITPTVDSTNSSGLLTASPNFFNTFTPKAYYSMVVKAPAGGYMDLSQVSSAFVFTHSPAYNAKIVYYVDDCQHLNPITPDSFIYAGSPVINAKDTLPAHENLLNNINAARHPYPYYTINFHGKTLRVFHQIEVRYYFFNIDISGAGHRPNNLSGGTVSQTGRYVGYDTAFVLGTTGIGSIASSPSVISLCTNSGGVTLNASNFTNIGSIQNNKTNNPTYTNLLKWSQVGNSLFTATGSSVSVNPSSTATYVVGDGCGYQNTSIVTVNTPSAVTVGKSSITACTGATVALSATGAVTYSWSPSVTQVISGLTNVYTAKPTTTTTYTVTGTDAHGCVTTATETVTVSSSIAPTVAVGRSHIDTCSGSTVSLSATGALAYSWNGSNGDTSTKANPTFTPSYTTIYLVTGSNILGCTNTAVDTIQVGTAFLQPLTGLTAICNGGSTTLKAIGATTYSWAPSTGLSATTGAQVTASPTVTTTYTVTGAIAGCTSTTANVVVTVNNAPSITATSSTICNGSSDSLKATNGTTFVWAPYASLSINNGAKVSASPSTTTTYTVTNDYGCSSTYTVGVNARPTATVTGTTAICNGQSTNVTFTLTGSGPWTIGYAAGTTTSTVSTSSSPATLSVNPGASTNYTVVSLSDANCSAIASDYSSSNAFVTVNATPYAVSISPTIYDVCVGSVSKIKVVPAPTGPQSQTFTYTNPDTTDAHNILPGAYNLKVTGMPHGATITKMEVTAYVHCETNFGNDVRLMFGSPNGSTISLVNGNIATGPNSTGANANIAGMRGSVFTSDPSVTRSTGSYYFASYNNARINGVDTSMALQFKPEGSIGVENGNYVTPIAKSNVSTFQQMWNSLRADSGANGVWTMYTDNTFNGSSPTVTVMKYSVKFYYSYAPSITWTPVSGLYTDIGAVNSYTSGSNNDSVYASPTTSTTYTATVTIGTCSATGTATVNVNSNPTVSTSGSITICSGSSTTLTASGTGTFSWSGPSGYSATGSSITVNPTTTSIYTVTATSGSCTAIAYDTVKVVSGSGPSVSVSPTSVSGCSGSNTLTASGASTYMWSPSTGLSASTGSSVTAAPSSTTTYTVTGSNGTCTNTATAVVTVGVAVSNPVTICSGSSTTLTASGATTYSWSPSTGLSATTGASVTANPTTTTTYTVSGTSTGCGTTTATVVVTVNPTPNITVGNSTLCLGGSTYMSVPATSTYSWTPTSGLSAATGSYVTVNPTASTTYVVTSARNCSSTQVITVNPRPTSVLSGTTAICNGTSTKLALSLTGTSPWNIKLNGVSYSTTNAADTITITPSATTYYHVTSLTDAHCAATASADTTGNATVTVNADSTVTITPSAPAAVCAGNIDTFTAASHYTGTISAASGSINKSILYSTSNSLNISGIPTNSKITNVAITYLVTKSGYTSDLRINLLAPNGKVVNLTNGAGGTGGSFLPIHFAANATTPTNIQGYLYSTYTYKADAGNNVKTSASITSNTTSWSVLDSLLNTTSTSGNGNWTLSVNDSAGTGAPGVLNNWAITVYYTTSSPAITWSPVNGLYTDKAATVAYTGGAASKVYAKPTSTTTYLASVSYGTCGNSSNAVASINALPTAGFNPSTNKIQCGPGAVTLPVALTGATPWSITYNDGSNHTVSSSSATYNVLGTISGSTNYIIKSVTDNNGCKAVLGSDSMRSVFVLSTNPTTVSPASSTICGGGSQSFTLNGYPAGSGATIQWQYSANPTASRSAWTNFGTNSTTSTLSSINGTTYVRALDSASGCTVIASTSAAVIVDSAAKLTATNVTASTVNLSWTKVLGATSYTINYGSSTINTTGTTYTLTGLTSCTAYSIYITANGAACTSSATGNTVNITTLATPLVLNIDTTGGNIVAHWNGVKGNRYKLYISTATNLSNVFTYVTKDTTYKVLTNLKGNTINAYVVADSGSACSTKPTSKTLVLNIAGGSCSASAPVLTVTTLSTSITATWTSTATSFRVFFKRLGTTSWSVYPNTSKNLAFTGLAANTSYIVYVQNMCGSASGFSSALDTVTTPKLCTAAANLVLSNATCHGFTGTWNAVTGASSYQVYFTRTSGSGAPSTASYPFTGTSFKVTSFGSGVSYSVYIKANCTSGGQSTASNTEKMTTLSVGCKEGENGSIVNTINSFNVYPNPNNGNFEINMNTTAAAQTATVQVVNILGQVVYSGNIANNNGSVVSAINLNNQAAGLYIVRIVCGNDIQEAKVQIAH